MALVLPEVLVRLGVRDDLLVGGDDRAALELE